MKMKSIFIAAFSVFALQSQAQDTLKLSLFDAENLFLKNNYQLLLAKYEIDQSKADVITAKLFDNPEITHENLFYNHETKRFFETSFATGQFTTQISQLIRLAGKRNKNIALANTAVKLEEYQYFDLMKTLRYQLRHNFIKLYSLQQSIKVFGQQISGLEQLLQASNKQLQLGNIAAKDVIRIKSLVYNLKAEQHQMSSEIDELSADLKLLTQIKASTTITTVNPYPEVDLKNIPFNVLLDSAMANRFDLKSAKTAIHYAQQNLKLQKANAIPDVQLSLAYDLKGNYPEKYTGLGISIPISFFNRNQGEIKKAKIAIQAQEAANLQLEQQLSTEVFKAYQNAQRVGNLTGNMDKAMGEDYQKLMEEMVKNFQKRNISLLEFLDFYESYRETILSINQLKYEQLNAREEINFVTGTHIYK